MAKITAGPFSGPSGKIGNLIGSNWRGISYLKARPEHYRDANTIKQQAARMRLKLLIPFLKACLPIIRTGFLGYSTPQLTAYNAATSYNLRYGITGAFPCLELNYANLKISRGTLPVADNSSVEIVDPGKILFTWSTVSPEGEARPDDSAMVLAYNPVSQNAAFMLQGSTRGAGSCQLPPTGSYSGDIMECYLGFVNFIALGSDASEKNISDSLYLGQVTVL